MRCRHTAFTARAGCPGNIYCLHVHADPHAVGSIDAVIFAHRRSMHGALMRYRCCTGSCILPAWRHGRAAVQLPQRLGSGSAHQQASGAQPLKARLLAQRARPRAAEMTARHSSKVQTQGRPLQSEPAAAAPRSSMCRGMLLQKQLCCSFELNTAHCCQRQRCSLSSSRSSGACAATFCGGHQNTHGTGMWTS